jgi:hypothetical protein
MATGTAGPELSASAVVATTMSEYRGAGAWWAHGSLLRAAVTPSRVCGWRVWVDGSHTDRRLIGRTEPRAHVHDHRGADGAGAVCLSQPGATRPFRQSELVRLGTRVRASLRLFGRLPGLAWVLRLRRYMAERPAVRRPRAVPSTPASSRLAAVTIAEQVKPAGARIGRPPYNSESTVTESRKRA